MSIEEQRIKDWKEDIARRYKPRPRPHRMSVEEMEERNKSVGFQKALAVGKSSEVYVAEVLLNLKFDVQDISMEKFGDSDFYSPFDLLVSSQFFLFVVDVKRRNYRVPIGVPINKLTDYESYDKYDAKNKLLIFHFPIRERHQDCFYITTKVIRNECHIVGPFYHIEIHQLTSLTTKALINTLDTRLDIEVSL